MKPYNLQGIAGLVERTKHPDTGCTMSVYVAKQAGIDADDPWVVVCETHGSMVSANSRAQARESTENPEWCEECAEALEGTMRTNARHSHNQTVVQYAVQQMFKGKSPAVAARNTAERLNGGTNMFIDSAHEVDIDPAELEDALWKNMAEYATKSPIKPGDERNVARGTLMYFMQWSWGKPPKTKLEDKLILYMDKLSQLTPNHAASQLEWIKGPGVDRDGHSLTWWKNKAAKWSRSEYDRPKVFIRVITWDRAGQRDEARCGEFAPDNLKGAKEFSKEAVESGGSSQIYGRIEIPYQSGVTFDIGEWKNNAADGYYVWSVDGKSFVPVSRNGPFENPDDAVALAKRVARGGQTYDAVITFGGDPEASDFEIWKSFKAWSGEVHYMTDLPKVGGRLREYR